MADGEDYGTCKVNEVFHFDNTFLASSRSCEHYSTPPMKFARDYCDWSLPIFGRGSIGGRKKRGNRPPFFGKIPT
jgi:hypothetical protein